MDEAAFRASRGAVGGPPCVLEKTLLARCADCSLAAFRAIAEREEIGCLSPVARTNCATLFGMLCKGSAFALRHRRPEALLSHAIAMRLQCGGVAGLAQAVDADDAQDVHALVAAAQDRYGGLSAMPWPGIVAAVTAWQGRCRREGHP